MDYQGQFNDKVIFITGGARGIGKGVGDILSERGASLAISDIDGEELKKFKQNILQKVLRLLQEL